MRSAYEVGTGPPVPGATRQTPTGSRFCSRGFQKSSDRESEDGGREGGKERQNGETCTCTCIDTCTCIRMKIYLQRLFFMYRYLAIHSFVYLLLLCIYVFMCNHVYTIL